MVNYFNRQLIIIKFVSKKLSRNSIVGDYRLIDFLSAGGMGEVYRAIHSSSGRLAAVKVLTSDLSDSGLVQRFMNEARIQSSLSHPNIAEFYQFIEADGHPCIIMEYIDGETLTERVKRCGPLRLSEALHIFKAIVDAIGYIHSYNIIHRDIKSSNIKISSTGRVKLLDFGIAKGSFTPGLTVTGAIVGTLLYISPEQLRGVTADTRSDIWALGVLLYEMVTGIVPFNADTFGDLYEKINSASYASPLTVNQYLPREVEAIISRCLRKNPLERYQTTHELLRDVDRLIASVETPPPPTVIARDDSREAKSNKLWIFIPVALFSMLIFLIVGVLVIRHVFINTPSSEQNEDITHKSFVEQPEKIESQNVQLPTSGIKAITIDVFEGKAEVHQDDKHIGVTPFELKAPVGEKVAVTLKRDGYFDKQVEFTVSDNKKQYTFAMEMKE
jgi:eukaryotic-like serine/threonine-protein kinase